MSWRTLPFVVAKITDIENFGVPTASLRKSVDGTQALVHLDNLNMEQGVGLSYLGSGYTQEEVMELMKTSEWYIPEEQEQELNQQLSINNVIEQLKKECEQKILGGFTSSAYQGMEKVYSSSLENQATISSLFMVALSNLSGVTSEPIEHKAIDEIQCYEWTEQEIIQLGKDLKNHITLCKKECETKILELMRNT